MTMAAPGQALVSRPGLEPDGPCASLQRGGFEGARQPRRERWGVSGIAESAWLKGEIRIARAPPGSIESNADVRDNNALTLHIGEPGMLDHIHIPEERAPSLVSMTGSPPAPAVVSAVPEDGKNESAGSPGRNCRKELTARPGPIECLASGQRPAASGQRHELRPAGGRPA